MNKHLSSANLGLGLKNFVACYHELLLFAVILFDMLHLLDKILLTTVLLSRRLKSQCKSFL